ncbi:longitudinals lacking protein, isoforms H/M/V-like isoform X4 [Palaemon carinicauda]|uniref:longitudinals lacking protein, isoforms H/M/V-like isoform X4 n=1 Tax=Palaemon carinicauda TaxID=392227 RepID=UPI0035B64640
MSDGMLSLSWNNHKATFCHVLSTLREKEKYTDVTVACEGRFYPVHKLVLSTCSEYFEKIFDNTPCKHPVIVLKDIAWDELEALLSYMYDGVVSVAQNDLARLIKAAEVLRIKGLAVPDEPPPSKNDVASRKSTHRSSDDRSSPHPKRRRREENVSQSSVYKSPSSSPARASPGLSESEPSRTHVDTRWKDHTSEQSSDRPLDDRLHQSASATSSSPQAPIEVMVDESLVKEEVEDTLDSRDDVIDSGMDYGSLGSDSRLDGSVGDDDGKMLPNKFEPNVGSQSESHSQPLPDAVVEALAGPSGMQGWLGGCEVPGSFSGMEGFSGDGSQDVHPPQQGPPVGGVQSGAHQMAGCESQLERFAWVTLRHGKRMTIEQTLEEICYSILGEANAIAEAGFPETRQDLFMEQGALCGVLGYRDFFKKQWLTKVLSWQRPTGCFGDFRLFSASRKHPSRVDKIFHSGNNRVKREESPMESNCLAHRTAVALGYLSLYVRWLAIALFT